MKLANNGMSRMHSIVFTHIDLNVAVVVVCVL